MNTDLEAPLLMSAIKLPGALGGGDDGVERKRWGWNLFWDQWHHRSSRPSVRWLGYAMSFRPVPDEDCTAGRTAIGHVVRMYVISVLLLV